MAWGERVIQRARRGRRGALALVFATALGLVAHPVVAGEMGQEVEQAATPTPVASRPNIGWSTFALSIRATARELHLSTTSDISVTLPTRPAENALLDACHLQSGVTYEQVTVALEITETDATLTCHELTATADEGSLPGTAPATGPDATDDLGVAGAAVESDQTLTGTSSSMPSLMTDISH